MKKRLSGVKALSLAPLFLLAAWPSTAGECDIAGLCQGELLRIEAACAAGMSKAGSAAETAECLRLRNVALALLVERVYQSTLSFMAERDNLLLTLQEDQGRWQDKLEKLQQEAVRDGGKTSVLDTISDMHRDRLRALTAITVAFSGN